MENLKCVSTVPLPLSGGEGMPVIDPAESIRKERKLIQCDTCGQSVNSEKQAQAHLNGMYHLNKLQMLGLPLPPGTDMQKLEQFNAKIQRSNRPHAVRHAGPGNGNLYNRRVQFSDIRMPCPGGPVMALVNNYNMKPYHSTASTKLIKCEICEISSNSATQAKSHLNGRKHLMKMVELGIPLPPGVSPEFLQLAQRPVRPNRANFEPPKFQERFNQRVPQFSHPERFQYSTQPGSRMFPFRNPNAVMNNLPFHNGPPRGGGGGGGPIHMIRTRCLIPCDVCQLLFNSQGQAEAHFQGSRHQKKIQMVSYYQKNVEKARYSAPSSKQIVCPVCHTTVNSDKQMEAHVQGKLHKSKLEHKQTSEVKELEEETNEESECVELPENSVNKSTSVYYLATNCVTASSLNVDMYHQPHYSTGHDGEPDESIAVHQTKDKNGVQ